MWLVSCVCSPGPVSAGLEGERGDVLLLLQRGKDVARGRKLLLGAAQPPVEHPRHSRNGESDRHSSERLVLFLFSNMWHVSFPPWFSCWKKIQLWLRTQVGSETYWIGLTDQIRETIWEWRDGTPYYEFLSYVPYSIEEKNKKKTMLTWLFLLLPETGWRASRTTSTTRTALCWWDTTMASGGTRSATSVRNSSASTPTVSRAQSQLESNELHAQFKHSCFSVLVPLSTCSHSEWGLLNS